MKKKSRSKNTTLKKRKIFKDLKDVAPETHGGH